VKAFPFLTYRQLAVAASVRSPKTALYGRQTIMDEAAMWIAGLVGALHMWVAATVAAAVTAAVAATRLHRHLV
jgi:hypothetical protein